MKLESSRQIFEERLNIKFNENPSSGSRVLPSGQTEGRMERLDTRIISQTYPPVKMEPTVCSETSDFNIQTTGKYPEENIP
jgi:hypothetical protein